MLVNVTRKRNAHNHVPKNSEFIRVSNKVKPSFYLKLQVLIHSKYKNRTFFLSPPPLLPPKKSLAPFFNNNITHTLSCLRQDLNLEP